MPLQQPLTQPAYTDLHAILTHYEAKETGLGHRIAHRLRDKAHRNTLDGRNYQPDDETGSEGCLFCTIEQEVQGVPNTTPVPGVSRKATEWARSTGQFALGSAEDWLYDHLSLHAKRRTEALDALDACIEDWLHIREATLPAHSVKVVAQGWTPRDFAALKAEVSQ